MKKGKKKKEKETKLPPVTSAKGVQEAKHSGGKWDDRRSVEGVTGLYLNIKPSNSKSWVYRYSIGGKRMPPMGFGSYPDVSLKAAREVGRECADLLAKGLDPKAERKKAERQALADAAKSITFKQYAEKNFVPLKEKKYKSAGQVRRLKQLLRDYIYPAIGSISIPDISRRHVIALLKQKSDGSDLYDDKRETANRVHNLISQIMRRAKSDELIPENPIVWKNDIELKFEDRDEKKSVPRPALYWKKLPAFVKDLLALDKPKGVRPDVQCILFGILTQARSNEARFVTWEEIDLKAKIWHVPGKKYKSENDWAIPLCSEAIKILKAQPSARHQEGRIFNRLDGGIIYDNALSAMGEALGYKEEKHPDTVSDPRWVVFNGFRRTFRTWAQAREFNNEAAELAMKHLDTAKLKQVYIDDPEGRAMFDRRRMISDAYQRLAIKGDGTDNVSEMSAYRKRAD